MDTAAPMRSNLAYNLLAVLLALGLAAGAALLFLSTNTAPRVAELGVGLPESVDCPFGSGAPVCYRYDLVNSGSASSFVRCEVAASGDTTAVFGNGETSYEGAGALEAGETWHLYVQVQAGEKDVVTEPTVGCGPVS
jgi:hypothetical protein